MKIAPNTFQGLHPTEEALFREVLKGMKGVGVEIGCLDGYSSAVILDASELRLHSIDPFVPDSMEASLIGSQDRYHENVRPYNENLTGFNWRSRLSVAYSHVVAGGHFGYTSIDFLFIDGDHTYPAVLQDYNDWTPLIKTGGILAIHDARMSRPGGANYHPGPSQVAKEQVFDRPDLWEIVGEAHSLLIARKK